MEADSENVERSRMVFELMSEEGVEAALPYIDSEFEMSTPPELASEPGTYVGHEGIKRWFDSFYEAMDEVSVVPVELRDAGPDHVAIYCELRARGRTSGLEFNQNVAMLTTVRDGLLLRIEYFEDLDGALAEGLSR